MTRTPALTVLALTAAALTLTGCGSQGVLQPGDVGIMPGEAAYGATAERTERAEPVSRAVQAPTSGNAALDAEAAEIYTAVVSSEHFEPGDVPLTDIDVDLFEKTYGHRIADEVSISAFTVAETVPGLEMLDLGGERWFEMCVTSTDGSWVALDALNGTRPTAAGPDGATCSSRNG